MAGFSWAFAFGLLGNIVSFLVYLSPIPTFYQIYKKKTSEGFQSVPYVVALFSAMLWIYYAFLKSNTTLLITINSVGCFIETIYIVFYLVYASKKGKVQTMKLIVGLIICGFGFIVLSTYFLAKPSQRVVIVGWICLVFSLCVFIAPLCIVRKVIQTKSVEYMPFLLSLFLTISAITWFFYGFLIRDYNIAIPNVLGLAFGVLQMALYIKYKNSNTSTEEKLPEMQMQVTISLSEQKMPEIDILVLDETKTSEIAEKIVDIAKFSSELSLMKIPEASGKNIDGLKHFEPQNLALQPQA
ncbi:bidirectional sugar transporter SWEET14-like [Andrographis paniculata]|uniref:bidirectional sugar transporter SWEET14-like n=1 Tax=Andrographis paniculata TaxID=175694 RepID=UPI0021E83932|nr:bidirectional sugar transporter SWEET14-like [Andrographis paniculata]